MIDETKRIPHLGRTCLYAVALLVICGGASALIAHILRMHEPQWLVAAFILFCTLVFAGVTLVMYDRVYTENVTLEHHRVMLEQDRLVSGLPADKAEQLRKDRTNRTEDSA